MSADMFAAEKMRARIVAQVVPVLVQHFVDLHKKAMSSLDKEATASTAKSIWLELLRRMLVWEISDLRSILHGQMVEAVPNFVCLVERLASLDNFLIQRSACPDWQIPHPLPTVIDPYQVCGRMYQTAATHLKLREIAGDSKWRHDLQDLCQKSVCMVLDEQICWDLSTMTAETWIAKAKSAHSTLIKSHEEIKPLFAFHESWFQLAGIRTSKSSKSSSSSSSSDQIEKSALIQLLVASGTKGPSKQSTERKDNDQEEDIVGGLEQVEAEVEQLKNETTKFNGEVLAFMQQFVKRHEEEWQHSLTAKQNSQTQIDRISKTLVYLATRLTSPALPPAPKVASTSFFPVEQQEESSYQKQQAHLSYETIATASQAAQKHQQQSSVSVEDRLKKFRAFQQQNARSSSSSSSGDQTQQQADTFTWSS